MFLVIPQYMYNIMNAQHFLDEHLEIFDKQKTWIDKDPG